MARIALVHDVAGVAEMQVRILREAGYEVDHLRLPDFGANWPVPAKALTLPIRLILYLPTVLRVRRGGYDVVHIHWVPRGIIGVLSGRPYAVQAHGSDLHQHVNMPAMRWLRRLVLGRASVIFYVTPNLEQFVHPFAAKSFYLPNPINVGALDLVPAPPTSVRRAVIFMRLDPVKGVDRVFPAVDRLAAMGIELTALRWGPLAEEFGQRYSNVVRFVDPVPHERIGSFLSSFDLVIGQMEQGALGLSELEAMAAGRPLISGIDRSQYPGDKPPVVSSYDPDELVEQVERLKDDSRRLENMFREGRAWVRRNHGFERHLELLESAYFGTPARVSELPIAM